MNRIVPISILLLALSAIAGARVVQQAIGTISKQELISMLKDSDGRRLSQADIATEVGRRGIAFAVDEKTLEELRQAGARSFLLDAIDRAGKNGGRLPASDPAILDEEARRSARAEAIAKLPLLEQARLHALQFAQELPNFIVAETVTRYLRTPYTKDWELQDKLELELTYRIDKGEEVNLLRVDGKATRQSYQELGGSTSTGEFGSTLTGLFSPQSKAEFTEVKREIFRGRPTVVYDFIVRRANSTNKLGDKDSRQKTIVGYSGSVWIDTESKYVLRIEESATEIPAGFPVTLSENAVEYDWVTIGGERYLLPVRAEVLLGRDSQRLYTRNVIEFRNYRKFEGKIKLDPN
jgi:hypothetical protein